MLEKSQGRETKKNIIRVKYVNLKLLLNIHFRHKTFEEHWTLEFITEQLNLLL